MTQITIPNVPTEVSYSVTSASTGPFTVPFPFFDEDDVKATVTDALGVETALVHSTDFTFTTLDVPAGQEGSGYESGAITLNASIGADGATTLRIYRDTVVDRTANYPNTGPFSMPLLNDEQNKHIAIMQELDRVQTELNAAHVVLTASIATNTADIATNAAGIADNANTIAALTANDPGGAYALLSNLASQAAGLGASLIGIQDLVSVYAATNVEDALAEVHADTITNLGRIITAEADIATNASDIAALETLQAKHKPADTTVTNNVNAVENDLIGMVVVDDGLYEIDAYLHVNFADALAGMRVSFSGTKSLQVRSYSLTAISEAGATDFDSDNAGVEILIDGPTLGSGDAAIRIKGYAWFSASGGNGTYKLNWGQRVSGSGTVTLKKGSFFKLRKLN